MLYDAHSHLDLIEENLKDTISDARKTNVCKIISCSTSFASNQKNLSLQKEHKEIMTALGLHPLNLIELTESEMEKALEFIENQIFEAKAIGEVGLDFKYAKKEWEIKKQKKYFEEFINLSKKYDKPLIIHSRYAQKQVLKTLEEKNGIRVLLHSFVDSQKLMKKATIDGHFVSVGLNILYNEQTQKNISSFPLERLLFETDTPIRFNNEKAHPSKIALILKKVAEIKGLNEKEVEKQQEKNFKKIFGSHQNASFLIPLNNLL